MLATLPFLIATDFPPIRRKRLETLQVNLGYTCNQTCVHCHVNAGPNRTEQMSRQTIDTVLTVLRAGKARTLDLTGGAPEMNRHFRYLVAQARKLGVEVIDRCNLTILQEPGYETLAEFLALQQVKVVASLPCYQEDNVDRQRGKGTFQTSLRALKQLNLLGYGQPDSGLQLDLVYNPQGASLPPPQAKLEAEYKRYLGDHFNIVFNHLLTLANMPIQRFGSTLRSKGQFHSYMQLLRDAHQDSNLEGVMCRTLVSVDWEGYLHDCDFNQMLGLALKHVEHPRMRLENLLRTDI